MNAGDPLAALKPLRTPPPVDGWPPAPGWWLLALLACVALLALAWFLLDLWRRRAYLRRARQELAGLRQHFADDPAGLAAACNALLKRVALVRYPHRESASLAGAAWIRFLNTTAPGEPFSAVSERLPYAAAPAAADADAFCAAAERWLRAQGRGSRRQ